MKILDAGRIHRREVSEYGQRLVPRRVRKKVNALFSAKFSDGKMRLRSKKEFYLYGRRNVLFARNALFARRGSKNELD